MKVIACFLLSVFILSCSRQAEPVVFMSKREIQKIYSKGIDQKMPLGSILDPRGISDLRINVRTENTSGTLEYIGRWPLFGAPLAQAEATSQSVKVSIGVSTTNSVKAWDRLWGGLKDLTMILIGIFLKHQAAGS